MTREGEPWFVAKDAADLLGYADTTNAIKQHCRGVAIHHPIVDSIGRTQNARIIAESDLLRLIIGSRLPAAEKFERWVFEDVLPSIRKTGGYGVPAPAIDLNDPASLRG
jgi:prophage antirepressor-like protein